LYSKNIKYHSFKSRLR